MSDSPSEKFRVLICGDRNWTDERKIRDALLGLLVEADVARGEVVVVEGAARGADRIAGHVARTLGIEVEEYPYSLGVDVAKEKGAPARAGGHFRNQLMLDTGISHAIACHSNLAESRGTKDMVKRLLKADVPVEFVV